MPADFIVRILGDSTQFGRTINQAAAKLDASLGSGLTTRLAGLFGATAITAAVKNTIEYASRFQDMSAKLGVGAEFLQEAAYAAEQTGASLGDVEMALRKIQIAQVAALGG